MCQDNYTVRFLKLIKYREKKAKIEFKIQGEKKGIPYTEVEFESTFPPSGLCEEGLKKWFCCTLIGTCSHN